MIIILKIYDFNANKPLSKYLWPLKPGIQLLDQFYSI
jgi:hypothetical protein